MLVVGGGVPGREPPLVAVARRSGPRIRRSSARREGSAARREASALGYSSRGAVMAVTFPIMCAPNPRVQRARARRFARRRSPLTRRPLGGREEP